MLNKPLVSVLVPVYNAENYLKSSLDSIINQTYTNLQIVIIDDCCSDKSPEIISAYNDNRIECYRNDVNLKLIKTLNKGISLLKGEYTLRMDADDIAHPNLIETLVEKALIMNAKVVAPATIRMSDDSKLFWKTVENLDVFNDVLRYVLPFNNYIGHPGVLIETSILKLYKYTESESVLHLEDKDLWCRVSRDNHLLQTINENLLLYRSAVTSVTNVENSLAVAERLSNHTRGVLNNLDFSPNECLMKLVVERTDKQEFLTARSFQLAHSSIKEYLVKIFAQKKVTRRQCRHLTIWRERLIIFHYLRVFSTLKFGKKVRLAIFAVRFPFLFIRNIRFISKIVFVHQKLLSKDKVLEMGFLIR